MAKAAFVLSVWTAGGAAQELASGAEEGGGGSAGWTGVGVGVGCGVLLLSGLAAVVGLVLGMRRDRALRTRDARQGGPARSRLSHLHQASLRDGGRPRHPDSLRAILVADITQRSSLLEEPDQARPGLNLAPSAPGLIEQARIPFPAPRPVLEARPASVVVLSDPTSSFHRASLPASSGLPGLPLGPGPAPDPGQLPTFASLSTLTSSYSSSGLSSTLSTDCTLTAAPPV